MALEKSLDMNDTGIELSYWRVLDIYVNNKILMFFRIEGYKDGAARLAGKKSGFTQKIMVNSPIPDTIDIYKIVYGILKGSEQFINSKDV